MAGFLQAFLAGVSAAVVGVIIVVSLDLIPSAIVGVPSIAIAVVAFLAIVLLKVDVAYVARRNDDGNGLCSGASFDVKHSRIGKSATRKLRSRHEMDHTRANSS